MASRIEELRFITNLRTVALVSNARYGVAVRIALRLPCVFLLVGRNYCCREPHALRRLAVCTDRSRPFMRAFAHRRTATVRANRAPTRAAWPPPQTPEGARPDSRLK